MLHDSSDQDENKKQAEHNSASINHFSFLRNQKSARKEGRVPNIARNNDLQTYIVVEQETAL